jgi:hypothetical protein
VRCGTRALKNAEYLRRHVPEASRKDDAEGFGTGIPTEVLARLHRLPHDHPDLRAHEHVAAFLRSHELPRPTRNVRDALFQGTIHFAQVTFETPSRTYAVPDNDMATIVDYARAAIAPIRQYARQYGPTSGKVAARVIRYTAKLAGTSYTDRQLKRWVDEMAAASSLPDSACIVVVSPHGLRAQNVDANAGYHGKANIAYGVLGVFETGLALDDRKDAFAMVVSHEIAELVVDPNVDDTNPEVCDPCDLNCGPLHRCYFDASGKYLGSTSALPPRFPYSFYICAIVKPEGAETCPAGAADCDYTPKR